MSDELNVLREAVMMVEVTQEDRDTLDAATAEWRMGDSSVSLEIIAAYRQASYQRGKLEGARLALEEAFGLRKEKTSVE